MVQDMNLIISYFTIPLWHSSNEWCGSSVASHSFARFVALSLHPLFTIAFGPSAPSLLLALHLCLVHHSRVSLNLHRNTMSHYFVPNIINMLMLSWSSHSSHFNPPTNDIMTFLSTITWHLWVYDLHLLTFHQVFLSNFDTINYWFSIILHDVSWSSNIRDYVLQYLHEHINHYNPLSSIFVIKLVDSQH